MGLMRILKKAILYLIILLGNLNYVGLSPGKPLD
jgi:hypothetical protein